MFLNQAADGLRVQRIGMIDGADTDAERQAECPREPERMEERQHAHDLVVTLHPKNLRNRLQIGDDVVMREHHPLGLARGAR